MSSSAFIRPLVAPVKIGAGAYIGTGSVITQDVAPDALALARVSARSKSPAGRRHFATKQKELMLPGRPVWTRHASSRIKPKEIKCAESSACSGRGRLRAGFSKR